MAVGSKADPTRPPESILIWEKTAEEPAPAVETVVPEPTPVVKPSSAPSPTIGESEEIRDSNFRMLGFFLIPALLLTSVLVGIGSAGSTVECGTIEEPESIGTKTIDGTTYALYRIENENLGRVVGGNGVREDEACTISDTDARMVDSYRVVIETRDYNTWTECIGDVYHCENNRYDVDIYREGRFTWMSFVEPGYPDKEVDSMFTYDNRGLFSSGSFVVAAPEVNDVRYAEIKFTFYDNTAQLTLALAITPLGLILARQLSSGDIRSELREGITGFLKFGFKAGFGFAIFMMLLAMFILLTW